MGNLIIFELVTPNGVEKRCECRIVDLVACDNDKGEGGGSVGIMHGHLPAVIALKSPSSVKVKTEEDEFCFTVCNAFAEVKDNTVSVMAEKII